MGLFCPLRTARSTELFIICTTGDASMKVRMLAVLATFFFAPLLPSWAQRADLPGLEGVWRSCASHEEHFDLIPEKQQVIFDKQGKSHSEKYHLEGNQIKFAGRTLIMTNGELDE